MTKFSRKEDAKLRDLAQKAWEAELGKALESLFADFRRWADNSLSAFALSDRIHEFHDGTARALYKRYTGLPPNLAVTYALSHGILDGRTLDPVLLHKLAPRIEALGPQGDDA